MQRSAKPRAHFAFRSLVIFIVLLVSGEPVAFAGKSGMAYIAVIIDDVGNSWARGLQAIRLPGPVAISVIPDLTYSTRLAQHAYGRRKDVILHMPMEPMDRKELLAPIGLKTDMDKDRIAQSLETGFESVPHAVAINNHMGSQYTSDAEAMDRLMSVIHEQKPEIFFVDSLTTPKSKVSDEATAYGIPSLARDIFLDNERDETAIEQQFDKLVAIARQRGYAIAIGHPYQETLAVLQRRLASLSDGDVRLIPLTMLVAMKTQEREPWR
ncbi:MAG: divergent polysaccharide deacetylase family protein [Acidiferrobacterales bacterium]|jgi:polysaccharide deacetylase 2 family uncharacterized protein YibQ|nr:divergent polysaccharide deacetylase family protein [Acidiferrobacterales bacterium]